MVPIVIQFGSGQILIENALHSLHRSINPLLILLILLVLLMLIIFQALIIL